MQDSTVFVITLHYNINQSYLMIIVFFIGFVLPSELVFFSFDLTANRWLLSGLDHSDLFLPGYMGAFLTVLTMRSFLIGDTLWRENSAWPWLSSYITHY